MSSAATLMRFSGGRPQSATRDVSIVRVRVLGAWARVIYRGDDHEWRRRSAEGLGAVLAWDLLDTLMDLPVGMPVPMSSLTGPAQRRLRKAPRGVACISGSVITRQIVPAVTPLLAVISTRSWRDGLVAASRFACYCPRIVVVPALGSDEAEALALAREFGIGLAVSRAASAGVLLEPEPVRDWEPTPAWWWLCEDIYRQAAAEGR